MAVPILNAKDNSIFILGHVSNRNYQRAKWILEKIVRQRLARVFKPSSACGLFESDFQRQLWNFQHAVGDVFWTCRSEVMVFVNGVFLGDDESLRQFLNRSFTIPVRIPSLDAPEIQHSATLDFLALIEQDKKRQYVYLDVGIDGCCVGSLVICLYTHVCPVSCERFKEYIRTTRDEKRDSNKPGYIGTRVHRIASPSFLQCGDIEQCTSIFPDESFAILHDRRGVVSFSNIGPNTNKCQFIISLNPNPWMNRNYVAFGQVVEGMQVLDWIEAVPTFYESPMRDIEFLDCGLLPIETSSHSSQVKKTIHSYDRLPSAASMNEFPYDLKSIPDESDIHMDIKHMVARQLQEQPLPIKDNPHPGDTPSDHLLLDRYVQGLYTMPREYQVYAQHLKKVFPNTTEGLDQRCKPDTALRETYCKLDLPEDQMENTSNMNEMKSELHHGLRHKLMDALQHQTSHRPVSNLMFKNAPLNQKYTDEKLRLSEAMGRFQTPCEGNTKADPRQHYSLVESNSILNPGVGEETLRGKTDEEILRLFDDVTICADVTESEETFPIDAVGSMDFLDEQGRGDGLENSDENSTTDG